jgi:Ca2+-binding EF-hand superfamily protein
MGCSSSTIIFTPNTTFPGQDDETLSLLLSIRVTKNYIDKFYTEFVNMDRDNSGMIIYSEMLAHFDMEDNTLNRKVFSFFDCDDSGQLNFLEFSVMI